MAFHPHPQPALQPGDGLEGAVALVGSREPAFTVGEGHQEKAGAGEGGGNLKVHSLTSNFLMFSGGKGLWEAANDPGSCGSTFLSSLQLKFPAFPYFWPHPSLMQQLDQDQGTSLLPSPPPLMSPGGQWTPL